MRLFFVRVLASRWRSVLCLPAVAAATLSCDAFTGPSQGGPPIALYFGQPEGSSGIDILAVRGAFSGPRENITSEPGSYRGMSLSPDGRRLLVTHIRGDVPRRRALAMGLDGRNIVQVSGDAQNVSNPRWSPDGSLVTYTAVGSRRSSIWVARADGSERWQVAEAAADSAGPDYVSAHGWTPSGDVIYHEGWGSLYGWHSAMVVPAAGGAAQPLFGRRFLVSPEWSPDGARVAYVRSDSAAVVMALEVAAADGSDPLEIVPATGLLSLQPPQDAVRNSVRRWSPDGQWISYYEGFYVSPNVVVVRSDGSSQRTIATSIQAASFAGWSSDGRVTVDRTERVGDGIVHGPYIAAPDAGAAEAVPVGPTFRGNFLWITRGR